jgi:hypothetical protein
MKTVFIIFAGLFYAGTIFGCPMIQGNHSCVSEYSEFKMNIVQKNVIFRFFDRNDGDAKISSFIADGKLRQFKNHYSSANYYKSSCVGLKLEIDILETNDQEESDVVKYTFERSDNNLKITRTDQDENIEVILCRPSRD